MARARVLIVDDDPQILRAVKSGLEARDYAVVISADGAGAIDVIAGGAVDLVLLDLGLPGIPGQEVVERVRQWSDVPIIILSVQDSRDDTVAALDAGADDYITKPFDTGELLARMRAVQRRTSDDGAQSLLRFGELEFDLAKELVRLHGEAIHLTPTEYRLLQRMALHPGKLLTHAWLLQQVWGPGYSSESHYLRVFVRSLRQKLNDDPAAPTWITTEPGLGYRWLPQADQI